MIIPSEVSLRNSDILFIGVDDWLLIGVDYEGGLWYYNTENDRRHENGPTYDNDVRNWHDLFLWAIRDPGEVEWYGYDESLERSQARRLNNRANEMLQKENTLRREQGMRVLLQNIPLHGF